ncbi:MAG: SUMF1/EgtB/PvdO family nonheme iron enzyme [Planctomycetota bacterium]|jgi:formylglycine-generating enzyme required for sulfatase activity
MRLLACLVAVCGALCGLALAEGAALPGEGQRYALVVGINDYEQLGTLGHCRQDAEALAQALVEVAGYDDGAVRLLADGDRPAAFQPTHANLRHWFDRIVSLPEEGDTLLIFFAGWGLTIGGDGYLMPADGIDEGSALSITWLRERLRQCKAAHKLVIVDVNHLGGVRQGLRGIAPEGLEGMPAVALTSCGANEVSQAEGTRGIFAAGLLEGLSGLADVDGDGWLTVAELFAYSADYMVGWSRNTGTVQTPVMMPPSGGEFAIALSRRRILLDLGVEVAMELALVPAGEFVMGSPPGEERRDPDEGPQHLVWIARPYYVGVTEVTQAQWRAVMGTEPWAGRDYAGISALSPASYVSWEAAARFCRQLSLRVGRTIRLPTEAEWEYACRAGSAGAYAFGNDPESLRDYGWYAANASAAGERYPRAVARKRPNAWGVYDMHGNVSEWCQSLHRPYPYRDSDGRESLSASGSRVLRGGSWAGYASSCRSAARSSYTPTSRGSGRGFRVAADVKR